MQNTEVVRFFLRVTGEGGLDAASNIQTQMRLMPQLSSHCLLLFPVCLWFFYTFLLPECLHSECMLFAEVQATTLKQKCKGVQPTEIFINSLESAQQVSSAMLNTVGIHASLQFFTLRGIRALDGFMCH